MRDTHWLPALQRADDPTALADQVTAARVLNALLMESAGPHSVRRGSGGEITVTFERVEISGYGELFTEEVTDARVALVTGRDRALGIDEVVELVGLAPHAHSLLRSNRDVMVAVARKFFADTRQMSWAQLCAKETSDLYLLLEQDGNPERPLRNPIAHSYLGDLSHHPFVGVGEVSTSQIDDDVRTVRSAIPGNPRHRRCRLVVHPQSEHLMRPLGPRPYMNLFPTTSARTLYDPDLDRHYKTSFAAQITSHTRLVHRDEGANAIAATDLLSAADESGLLPAGLFFLPELAWASHGSCESANCLERGGLRDVVPALPDGARVVPMSSFNTPLSFCGGASLFEQLCAASSPVRVFRQIVDALVDAHLGLLHLGISHETHAQNTLLVADLGTARVHGVCLRDIEAIKVDPARIAAVGLPMFHSGGSSATHSQAILEPGDADQRRFLTSSAFTHGVIDSQVSLLAATALDAGWHTAADAAKVVADAVNRARVASTYLDETLLDVFWRRNLAHKGLGLAIDTPYRHVQNVLFGRR